MKAKPKVVKAFEAMILAGEKAKNATTDFNVFLLKNMKIKKYKKATTKEPKYIYAIIDPMTSHLKYFYTEKKKAQAACRVLENRNFKFKVIGAPVDLLLGYVGCHPQFELQNVLKTLKNRLCKKKK